MAEKDLLFDVIEEDHIQVPPVTNIAGEEIESIITIEMIAKITEGEIIHALAQKIEVMDTEEDVVIHKIVHLDDNTKTDNDKTIQHTFNQSNNIFQIQKQQLLFNLAIHYKLNIQ